MDRDVHLHSRVAGVTNLPDPDQVRDQRRETHDGGGESDGLPP
jgi:hypothetical protein